MNRAERRRVMKKFPGYRKALKSSSKKAVDDLEEMFQKQWDANRENFERGLRRKAVTIEDYVYNDEILNNGEKSYDDDGDDDIYND